MVLIGYLTGVTEWVDDFGTRRRQITLCCVTGGVTQEIQLPWIGPWPVETTPTGVPRDLKFSLTVRLLKDEDAGG